MKMDIILNITSFPFLVRMLLIEFKKSRCIVSNKDDTKIISPIKAV